MSDERAAALIEKMKQERGGKLWPAFEYVARLDPDFLEGYNAATRQVFNYGAAAEDRAVDAKVKELIAIALLASVRGSTTGSHIRKCYELGATRREVLESLEVAYQVTGAPAFEFGVQCMMEIDDA